jgi:hypothetical protein
MPSAVAAAAKFAEAEPNAIAPLPDALANARDIPASSNAYTAIRGTVAEGVVIGKGRQRSPVPPPLQKPAAWSWEPRPTEASALAISLYSIPQREGFAVMSDPRGASREDGDRSADPEAGKALLLVPPLVQPASMATAAHTLSAYETWFEILMMSYPCFFNAATALEPNSE